MPSKGQLLEILWTYHIFAAVKEPTVSLLPLKGEGTVLDNRQVLPGAVGYVGSSSK